MFEIKPIANIRQIHFESFKLNNRKPIYTFLEYRIYKLKILISYTNPEFGEIAFQVMNQDKILVCIIYCTLLDSKQIDNVKYWRILNMDAEMCWLLVQGFLYDYLCNQHFIPIKS